jgi:uncharacterized protein YodC (DUF2158 family)
MRLFHVGEMASLNSGGPKMEVLRVKGVHATCGWRGPRGGKKRHRFHMAMLTLRARDAMGWFEGQDVLDHAQDAAQTRQEAPGTTIGPETTQEAILRELRVLNAVFACEQAQDIPWLLRTIAKHTEPKHVEVGNE